MLIVLSPAKTLDFATAPTTRVHTQPELLDESARLIERLVALDAPAVGDLMHISAELADLNAASQWSSPSAAVTLPSLPWRDLLTKDSETSVWWVSPTGHGSYQEVVHHGAFHRTLFSRLFHGAGR